MRLCLALLFFAPVCAFTLEVIPDAAWLDRMVVVDGSGGLLERTLTDLASRASVTITLSPKSKARASDAIIFTEPAPIQARRVLELLEKHYGICATATKETLFIEQPDEYVSRTCELRVYHLEDYGLAKRPRSQPTFCGTGAGSAQERNICMPPWPGHLEDAPERDPQEIVELIQRMVYSAWWALDRAGMEQRGGSHLFITATPVMHREIARVLTDEQRRLHTPMHVRVVRGTVAGDTPILTGLVTRAQAVALADRLTAPGTFDLNAVANEWSFAQARQESVSLCDAAVVNGHLDPSMDVDASGFDAGIRIRSGQSLRLIDYHITWMEPEPSGTTMIRAQPHKGTPPIKAGDGKVSPVTAEMPAANPGEQVHLTLPVEWFWQPRGYICVASDQALVLTCEHPAGQAVVILIPDQPAIAPVRPSPLPVELKNGLVQWQNQSLETVVKQLAQQTHSGLLIEPAALPLMNELVSLDARVVPLDKALKDITCVDCILTDGHLIVAPADSRMNIIAEERQVPIGLLLNPHLIYLAPLTFVPDDAGDSRSVIGPPIEAESPPESNEFVDIIQKCIQPTSWKTAGVNIKADGLFITIRHEPAVLDQIVVLLDRLERQRATQVIVRLYRLPAKLAADVASGVDVIAPSAWTLMRKTLVPVLTGIAASGDSAGFFCGRMRRIVQDVDVIQGIFDPIISTMPYGADISMNAASGPDGVLAHTRFQVCLSADFAESVISDDHGQALATITTPKLRVDAASDTRLLPDGSAAVYRCGERIYVIAYESVRFDDGSPLPIFPRQPAAATVAAAPSIPPSTSPTTSAASTTKDSFDGF